MCQKFFLIYASVNTNYYTAVFFLYISTLLNTYQVKLAIVEMFFVSYKCTNGNVLIFTRALSPTAGNGPKRVFQTHFERVNVLKMEAGDPKK